MDLGDRIMIVGGPGSGKSTLARRLGAALDLPVHHMDLIHWQPGWVQRERELRVAMAHAVEDLPAWVFEGGLSATYDHRAARATSLIWLDLPLPLRLWRVLRRTWQMHGTPRPDLPEGCPERFDRGKWELLRWMWDTRHTARARILRLMAEHPDLPAIHIKNASEVTAFERISGIAP